MRKKVKGAASYLHLHITNSNLRARRPRRYIITCRNEGCDNKRNGCEEAEDILGAGEGGVHCCIGSSWGAASRLLVLLTDTLL